MSQKGMEASAASAVVKSNVRVKKLSPETANTIRITLERAEAIKLARNLLVMATATEAWDRDDATGQKAKVPLKGDIRITAHANTLICKPLMDKDKPRRADSVKSVPRHGPPDR